MHDHTDPNQFRNTSLQNDRRNNRTDGLLRAKRIKLVDRRGVCTCKFQFMVKWDIDGFYIDSIMNSDFPLTHHVSTRKALKQLWKESCSEADNFDHYAMNGNARLELESCLTSFRQYCNQRKTSSETTVTSSDKENVTRIIPMTQGKYAGKSDRVFNTHHF